MFLKMINSLILPIDEQYFITMQQAWFMDEFIPKNCEIMDKYDPEKRVALVVEEW